MPIVTRYPVALNGNYPYPGNATVQPPGSYIQPTEGEALWWKYTAGGVGLVVGTGAFVTGIYLCWVKWQERASGRAARTTPVEDSLVDALEAPDAVGNVFEMEAINDDPPPPYDTPAAVIGLQQGRYIPDEDGIRTLERPDPRVAGRDDASAAVLADPGVNVASGHA
ncbi:hypothetical protein ACET3X_004758 [Alternaria dauci]|uniref:Uncharacterized protein n=1 Tax=Alternaria dauci TaxID=48095 RepID=A0ABR3UIB8_9PLEO